MKSKKKKKHKIRKRNKKEKPQNLLQYHPPFPWSIFLLNENIFRIFTERPPFHILFSNNYQVDVDISKTSSQLDKHAGKFIYMQYMYRHAHV